MDVGKAALRPEYEAPRAVLADRRGTTNFINISDTANSITAIRLQRLRLLGIIGIRAELIASIAWEAA
jgi:hypothetical protein